MKKQNKNSSPERTKKQLQQDEIAAQVAEMILSDEMRALSSDVYEGLPDDSDIYAAQRRERDIMLGKLASAEVASTPQSRSERIWSVQLEVTKGLLGSDATVGVGGFAGYFFKTKPGDTLAMSPSGEGGLDHYAPGASDVVQTNSNIMKLSNDEPLPMLFLEAALNRVADRVRSGGKSYQGPENFATMLKVFANKTYDQPLDASLETQENAALLVNKAMEGFDYTTHNEAPNIVEITNILSAVKSLPKHMVNKEYTKMILRHSADHLEDMEDKGVKVLIGALGKLDVSECPAEAAMVLDLSLRKGNAQSRTVDMASALRALANLPHTQASEGAVSTFLQERPKLENAANLDRLEEVNELLYEIVENVTTNQEDSQKLRTMSQGVRMIAMRYVSDKHRSVDGNDKATVKARATLRRIIEASDKI